MLPEPVAALVEALRPRWQAAGLAVGSPPVGLVIRGRPRGHKVNVVLYDRAGRRPLVFVKTAERAAAEDLLVEQEALERLAALAPPPPGIPRALGAAEHHERVVTAQTVVAGTPLAHALRDRLGARRTRASRDLRAAVGWLTAFQDRTRGAPVAIDLEAPIAAFADDGAATAGLSTTGAHALERHLATARRVQVVELPGVWAHGDYWPGNLVVGRRGVGVVDWGHLRRDASPLDDLCFLLYTVAHWMPWPREPWIDPGTAIARTFGAGWYADLGRELVAARLDACGVPRDVHQLLVVLTLLAPGSAPGRERVGPGASAPELVCRLLDEDGRRAD